MNTEIERYDPDIYSSLKSADSSNFLQFQIDNKDELEDLRAELLGLEWDDEKQQYRKSHDKVPMCNVIGANAIIATLSPRTTKIFSLSNHEQYDIDIRCRRYLDNLSIMLVRHKDLYGIPSYAVTDLILDTCDDIFRATLLKSINGWEGSGIRGQQQYQEVKQTIVDNRQPEKKGLTFPFINGNKN